MNGIDIQHSNPLEVARSISDLGFMAVATGFFLVIAAIMFVLFIRWFMKTMDKNMNLYQDTMRDLLEINKDNSCALRDIRENIGSKTISQIRIIIEYSLDSGKLKAFRALSKIYRENNLNDNRESIHKKVKTIVYNIYNDRDSKLDLFQYKGNRLSAYSKREWIDGLIDLFMEELFRNEGFEYSHAQNSIDIFYEDLKLKFIKSLESLEE